MTDSSDCESDAGASPSVSSEDSDTSTTSRCSSPSALKIVTPSCSVVLPPPGTPRRRQSSLAAQNASTSFNTSTPGSSFFSNTSSGFCSTPLSSVRKPARRRQLISSVVETPGKTPSTSRGTQSDVSRTSLSSSTGISGGGATTPRKRKRPTSTTPSTSKTATTDSKASGKDSSKLSTGSPEKKRNRNKRRRTRSERNILAGKIPAAVAQVAAAPVVVAEGEEVVALDAEIDRVLEEKALKSNLTAKNVKSIIHHVMTDNLVQKMFMSVVKRKTADQHPGGEGGDCSSDEYGLVEPKMTRAKTKELMGSNRKISLWPIVDSPVKLSKQPVSETHILIHNDLPEDSSGDEEYIPKGTMTPHSDDESSSVASSRNSDVGSPATKYGVLTRRSVQQQQQQLQQQQQSPFNDSMFKTPPPKQKPKALKKKEEERSAISLRTRSKLPLNDTPLEDLERQLVPPDITQDMYDWTTDNEDYMAFLKDFLYPGQTDGNEQDDDAADPEYNVMEDFEDEHDREELRMDRAVKVPKKELTQLIAELFESGGMLSGDDLDDHDLATLTGITPLVNESGYVAQEDTSLNSTAQTVANTSEVVAGQESQAASFSQVNQMLIPGETQEPNGPPEYVGKPREEEPVWLRRRVESVPSGQRAVCSVEEEVPVVVDHVEEVVIEQPPYFTDFDLSRLKHQIQQHVQLLTQSYVLTVSSEDPCLKQIAKSAQQMVIEMRNGAIRNGPDSSYSVMNIESAWSLVNLWPHKIISQSPIKKKILEEQYISERGDVTKHGPRRDNFFPRHVVKVIAESNAFMYNTLLPECYNQKHHSLRCRFSHSEDCLIAHGLDEMADLRLSAAQAAQAISEVLLVVHPQIQVYHRIRNLKKTGKGAGHCEEDIKKYFLTGELPPVDRSVPEWKDEHKLPLLQRDRRGLSQQWTALLTLIEDSPRGQWEERLSKDPVAKSIGRKIYRQRKKQEGLAGTSNNPTVPYSQQQDTINRVFPQGALMVSTPDPDVRQIPVVGANGRVGAIIKIPRLALIAPPAQEPREGDEAERRNTGVPAHPHDAEQEATTTINLLSLHHLTRRAHTTPVKLNRQSVTRVDGFLTPSRPPDTKVETGKMEAPPAPVSVYQVVGKPFDLPELGGDIGDGVIDLNSLQTPMKRKILEKVAEQEQLKDPLAESSYEEEPPPPPRAETSHEYEESEAPDSPNVILEGTEVELSEDESVEDEVEYSSRAAEVVTLSSEDEGPVSRRSGPTLMRLDDGDRSNSPPKNGVSDSNETGSQENTDSQASSTASTSGGGETSASRNGDGMGKGDDSDEEDERRSNEYRKKRPLPRDYSGDDDSQEKDRQKRAMHAPAAPPTTPNGQLGAEQQNSSIAMQQKRSPSGGKIKATSKYQQLAPPERLVDDSSADFEEVADAYMESYLARVQSVTEAYHPSIYPTFVQMLMEAEEASSVNQGELHSKVKLLFKDYPDLLREFESFLDPRKEPPTEEPNEAQTFNCAQEETLADIHLIQMIEKYTEHCPSLKAKIMSKLKSLKERPTLAEKDMAAALEPFFVGNPVMIEAFKQVLPSVYRPQSLSSDQFEVVELDTEDPPPTKRDTSFETVKLPDEGTVVATSSCPCVCHTKTSDPAFANRSKHCRKCFLKDGRIYIHNGRVMRPVSVNFSTEK